MRLGRFWTSERNLSVLAIVIVISVFGIGPLASPAGPGVALLGAAYLALLVSGIATVARRRLEALALGTVAVVSGCAYVVAIWSPGTSTGLARAITTGIFSLLLAGILFERVLRAGSVTVHRISGAVAAYLLIGLLFSAMYEAIEVLRPGSFSFPTHGTSIADARQPLVYFSYATLSTVGYGDVTALHPLARALSNLEALIGQLFPAILIARLVALEVSSRSGGEGRR